MAQALVILAILFLATPAMAAQDALTNRMPGQGAVAPESVAPGAAILLPDGRQTVIQEVLPGGQWRTELGIIVPPAAFAPGARITLPDGRQATIEEILPNGQWRTDLGLMTPPAAPKETPQAPDKGQPAEPKINPTSPAPTRPRAEAEPRYYTLAELLPTTQVPEKKEAEAVKPEQKEPDKKTPPKQEKPKEPEKKTPPKQEKAREPEKKPAQEKPKEPAKKVEKPKEPVKKAEKPRPGQELRIPDHASKTGNLDFLEGCWQGTRPEYYSKRTIKECFCFGAGGKNGKRRVLDYSQNRSCIGSSRASLSGSGVLRVISSGAVCNDGERWGQAEMVCRNSGPRTPCSWVFRDAQNGRQAYEIPFVRVESCGR